MKTIPNDDKFKVYCAITHALNSITELTLNDVTEKTEIYIVDDNLIKKLFDTKKLLEENILYHLKFAPHKEVKKSTEISREEIDAYFEQLKKMFLEKWENSNNNGYERFTENCDYILYK